MQTDVEKTTEKPAWLYVGDTKLKEVLIYPVNGQAAVGSIPLSSAPFGMACNSRGELIVSLFFENKVEVYSGWPNPKFVRSISGLLSPQGVAVGPNDKVYVTNHAAASGQPATIEVYNDDTTKLVKTFQVPLPFAAVGLCVDSKGVVYATCYQSIGGYVFEFVPEPSFTVNNIYPLVLASGICLGRNDELTAADATALVTIKPVPGQIPWGRAYWDQLGEGEAIRMLTSGPMGELYSPVMGPGGPRVDIRPEVGGTAAPRIISQGMESPFCCAVGS